MQFICIVINADQTFTKILLNGSRIQDFTPLHKLVHSSLNQARFSTPIILEQCSTSHSCKTVASRKILGIFIHPVFSEDDDRTKYIKEIHEIAKTLHVSFVCFIPDYFLIRQSLVLIQPTRLKPRQVILKQGLQLRFNLQTTSVCIISSLLSMASSPRFIATHLA